jgi:hypothetical protein
MSKPTLREAAPLADELRKLAAGSVEWRVVNPDGSGSYCMSCYTQREADDWLTKNRRDFPDGWAAAYTVERVVVQTRLQELAEQAADALAAPTAPPAPPPAAPAESIARPLGQWHDDDGTVTWWRFEDGVPLGEPSWIGMPHGGDWPQMADGSSYYTHWTPHPPMPTLAAQPVQAPAADAPIDMVCNQVPCGIGHCDQCAAGHYEQCRYAAAQAPAEPGALTDAEIALLWYQAGMAWGNACRGPQQQFLFARAIEARLSQRAKGEPHA